MLLPLHGLPTSWAFALLVVGAAILSGLVVFAARDRQRYAPLLAVLGLWTMAAALEVLKDRTVPRREDAGPHFMVVRNTLSLVLVAVPLALALLLHPSARCRRAATAVIGVLGMMVLVLAVVGWRDSLDEERQLWIAAARSIWSWPLARDGNLPSARWLWCAGSAMLALPSVRQFLRHRRGIAARSDTDLSWTLAGLAISSAAMAIFFWHQGDVRHRFYAYLIMTLLAYLAPLLALGETRIVTARWTRHALGGFGAALALWTLIGLPGSSYQQGNQDFADVGLTAILLYFLVLALPLLAAHLLLRALIRFLRRQRPAFK